MSVEERAAAVAGRAPSWVPRSTWNAMVAAGARAIATAQCEPNDDTRRSTSPATPPRVVGVVDRIAVAMAVSGATRFHRVAGRHDGRWRQNRT